MVIEIGVGWRRVANPVLCATFHIASYEPEAKRSKLLRFGKSNDVHPARATCFKSLSTKGDRLIFISHGGIFALSRDASELELLASAPEKHHFDSLWLSPDSTEAFVLQSNYVSDTEVQKTLVSADLVGGQIAVIEKFPSSPSYAGLSWAKRCFFVSYHAPDGEKRIDRLELSSNKSESVHRSTVLQGISLSERGNLIRWPLHATGPIEELNEDASARILADFGWYPSFSKNGDGAFLVGDHALWLRLISGELTQIASSGLPDISGAMDFPSWCHCGRHVAAMLSGTLRQDGWLARDLVFVDLGRKEVAIFDSVVVDPALNIGGQAWMPQ